MWLHDDDNFQTRLLTLFIVLEPLHHITFVYMDSSRDARGKPECAHPPIMTALLPGYRPPLVALKYIAYIMFVPSPVRGRPHEHVMIMAWLR